jgi:cellulose synthase/poly-beta-1,6-N-acetylglucosamine synthase-like glycosyltransferase
MYTSILFIAGILVVCYVFLLIYFKISWGKIPSFYPSTDTIPNTIVSVIIPARNEEKNIAIILNCLLKQDYPSSLFEIIVIDDHSTDETASVISSFSKNGVKLIQLKDEINSQTITAFKKKAIEVGINKSRGSLIVTTDADCTMNEKWLSTLVAFYEKTNAQMIVMPVLIEYTNSPLELFQATDFMSLQGITGAAVYNQQMGMCNGANLAYTKEVFEEVRGFEGIDKIASGDDMLLMHKIAADKKNKILYLKSKDVIVSTAPVKNIKEFLHQRIRWASKADKYQDKSLFPVLMLVYLVNVFLFLLFMIGLFSHQSISVITFSTTLLSGFIFLAFIKTLAEIIFLYKVSQFFNRRSLLWYFPLMVPFHILYTVIAGWLGKFGSYQWKGRMVG